MAVMGIGGSDLAASSFATAQARLDNGGDFAGKLKTAMVNPADDGEKTKLKKVCRDLESVFLNYMLKTMRDTVPKDSLTNGGMGEDIMQSMLDTELTKNMAQAGGIGLADMIYRQLSPATVKKSQAPG